MPYVALSGEGFVILSGRTHWKMHDEISHPQSESFRGWPYNGMCISLQCVYHLRGNFPPLEIIVENFVQCETVWIVFPRTLWLSGLEEVI